MGFGCNACGITGCRIIENRKERNIAILTNNFSPCNGRFPTMIAIITIFFTGAFPIAIQSAVSTIILIGVILLSIIVSLAVSKILSKLMVSEKDTPFFLELPPYRLPQIRKTLVRSISDRIIFVLGRAAAVAVPAGAVIWIMANLKTGNHSILSAFTGILEKPAEIMGLDGAILAGFLLGFPANEIVLPIILMIYLGNGSLTEYGNLTQLHDILISNGWNIKTAVCTLIFTIMHFPCSTSCLTVKKETGSIKLMLLAYMIPTVCGIILCVIINTFLSIFI